MNANKLWRFTMKFWNKVKNIFGDSIETISETTVELSSLAKLKWERHKIQKDIEKENTELGGEVYQLFVEKQEENFQQATNEIVEKLKTFHQQLDEKDKEIEKLSEDKETVDREHLREFRKDLELGGGAIEQIVIDENSPILNKKLMDIKLPKQVLLGAIVRNEKVIIPDGQTIVKNGDRITLLGESEDVEKAIQSLGITE